MLGTEIDELNHTVDVAAVHACRALLTLERFRKSADPSGRAAYDAVHELIGDLGSLRMRIAILDRAQQ